MNNNNSELSFLLDNIKCNAIDGFKNSPDFVEMKDNGKTFFKFIFIPYLILTIISLINSGLLIDNFIKNHDINNIYKIIIPIIHFVVVFIFFFYIYLKIYRNYNYIIDIKNTTTCNLNQKLENVDKIFTTGVTILKKYIYIIFIIFFVNIFFSIVNYGTLLYVHIDESKETDKKDNIKLIVSCIGIVISILIFIALLYYVIKIWPNIKIFNKFKGVIEEKWKNIQKKK
jgi:hypothetical protein